MDNSPEVVCYEKGSNWLGMWNVTWMTGTDEFGEPCHGGQYKNLWINGPKECQEFPNYTFDDHIGKAVASFPPQPVIRDYLEGRFTKTAKKDLKQFIKWNTVVRQVRYNKDTDNFTVTTEDLKARHTSDDTFTHVIVATGIFNVPNKPAYPGIETFNGRVIHSHDFRDATEYKGQRLLLIGGSYSAEDIALQTMKYGAKSVVTSYRTKPMNYKFPDGVMERPLVTKIENNTIYFKDGGDPVEVDVIILCTGYLYHFPYLDDDLRLYSSVSLYPAGLYKGTVWLKGGNNKLLYMGTQNQYYSFPMFDAQALWACRYIAGTLPNELRSMEEMSQDEQKWIKRCESLKGHHEEIDFQTEFLADLCKPTEYNEKVLEIRELWHKWIHDKDNNIVTYRDQRFTSVFTGTQAANRKPWYEDFDGSIKAFTSTEA